MIMLRPQTAGSIVSINSARKLFAIQPTPIVLVWLSIPPDTIPILRTIAAQFAISCHANTIDCLIKGVTPIRNSPTLVNQKHYRCRRELAVFMLFAYDPISSAHNLYKKLLRYIHMFFAQKYGCSTSLSHVTAPCDLHRQRTPPNFVVERTKFSGGLGAINRNRVAMSEWKSKLSCLAFVGVRPISMCSLGVWLLSFNCFWRKRRRRRCLYIVFFLCVWVCHGERTCHV